MVALLVVITECETVAMKQFVPISHIVGEINVL